MEDNNKNDINAALAALLAQSQQSSAPVAGGWNQPKPTASVAMPLGVSVPISLDTPAGKVRVYLQFGGENATSPQALMGLLESLAASGLPLDAWQQKQGGNSWGGNSGGYGNNQNRGGYGNNQNRGGYGNNQNHGGWR